MPYFTRQGKAVPAGETDQQIDLQSCPPPCTHVLCHGVYGICKSCRTPGWTRLLQTYLVLEDCLTCVLQTTTPASGQTLLGESGLPERTLYTLKEPEQMSV